MNSKLFAIILAIICLPLNAFEEEDLNTEIPYPFYVVHSHENKEEENKEDENKKEKNKISILHSGVASLEKRLQLINNAQERIEAEYFIFDTDSTSRIFMQALVQAAKRGVQVRILVDKSVAVFKLNKNYAKALSEYPNIEIRYYNAASMIRISSIQFRNHRKLLTVDDQFAITGGRNIADEYFDVSPEFNFLDTDIYLEGPIVKVLRESFDAYYEHRITQRPGLRSLFWVPRRVQRARDFLVENEEDRKLREKIHETGAKILASEKLYECPHLTYVTDWPGGNFFTRLTNNYFNDFRTVRKVLTQRVRATDKRLTLISPYMINNSRSRVLMHDLIDRGVEIDLYTNSLASTDAVYVAANLYSDFAKWLDLGINLHIHNGLYIDEGPIPVEEIKEAKWGMHAKVHIYESENFKELMVGTYNIDNRSSYYNTEMAIFCRGNDSLVADMMENTQFRIEHGYTIIEKDKAIDNQTGDEANILGADPSNKKLMKKLTIPSRALRFLL